MSTATVTVEAPAGRPPKAPPLPRNGVDTPALLATIGVVREQPQLAQFQFRAKSEWISGTHSRTTMVSFAGAGGEHNHIRAHTGDGDHPAVLCGGDNGPTPVEWVLTALASCLMAGIGNIASVRGVNLERVEARLEGDIDLRGILGLSDEVRNGYQTLRVRFEITGDDRRAAGYASRPRRHRYGDLGDRLPARLRLAARPGAGGGRRDRA